LDVCVSVGLSRAAIGQFVVRTDDIGLGLTMVYLSVSVHVIILVLSEGESDVSRGVDVEHVCFLVPRVDVLIDSTTIGVRPEKNKRIVNMNACSAGPGLSMGTRCPAPLMLLVEPRSVLLRGLHVRVVRKLLREPSKS
ncbi:hypothetical protein PMAYCL1PPCAC_03059, partial [Pristionchus mayeri]